MKRTGNKVLSIVLSAVLCTMMLPAAAWAQAAQAGDGAGRAVLRAAALLAAQDASSDISWYTADPDSDEFGIETSAQLRGLAQLVNGTAEVAGQSLPAVDFAGKTIYQTGAISLADGAFTPIGTPAHPFAGTYDGLGNAIASLRVEAPSQYAGLFGYVSDSGAIQNVRLQNGALDGGAAGGVALQADEYAGCVGSLAGQCDGAVSGCSSDVAVTVESGAQATAEQPYVVQRVGGLVGFARGDIAGCSYTGSLNVQVQSGTFDADSTSESLRVADSFGGIVGRFGDPDVHGTISDSSNEGEVVVQVHGAGAVDRFGTVTYANAFFVGGIAGYSNGSIVRCHNGAYNADTREVTGRVFTGVYEEGSATVLQGNRGADQTGGIVGGLRSVSEVPGKYNDGDPDDPMYVQDCYNEAQVTGLVAVGGIVGETGVYCNIERCYNGTVSDMSDWTRNQVAGKVVSTRWNKPMTGGIAGELRSGSIGYCANYAEVRNVQTGYYTAGIAGCIFVSDDYPNATGEIYACFNSGGVYTVNTTPGVEYREAGICGQNEGYVHDCIVMQGTVPYHEDKAIGANDWGQYANLYVKTPAELASSAGAALLNAIAAQQGDWSCYWFVNHEGYPVLNSWVRDAERTELTAGMIASAVQVAPAPFLGEGSASIPTLEITLTDGTVLVQNADFLVVPQEGAWQMSSGGAYSASITGIGMYGGTVGDCARYDIGACDLSLAAVAASPMKYAFGRVVFPEQVSVTVSGVPVSSDEIDYVIYNSATTAAAAQGGPGAVFPVFDSAGYISYTPDGGVKLPVSQIEGGLAGLNAETRDWWLYDRNRDLISDSAGNSYYTSAAGSSAGRIFGANTSCVNLKGGTPAGYVVKVTPRAGSAAVAGSAVGYYVIEPVNLYRECTFEGATLGDQTWYWDADKAKFYTEGAGGVREYDVFVPFSGESVRPVPSVSYGDYELVEGKDFRVEYGDPDPANGGAVSSAGVPNRNVTGTEGAERAGFTILPVNTSNISNYIIAYFDITPAAFADCEVSLDSDTWAYTGQAVEPPVRVVLNGVVLQQGVDYSVTYANNVEKGTASYMVNPLANLSGDALDTVSGSFQIVDGDDLADFVLGPIDDQQFNWGYDVHPKLAFYRTDASGNAAGNPVELVEGRDYTVSYSTANITNWADAYPAKDPCVVTVTGAGRYTGQVTGSFDIVPYDAAANATGQLRAFTQDIAYGMWGFPQTSNTWRDADGTAYHTDATANVGLDYPVMMVQARPIVDWAAYDAAVAAGTDLETCGCYGDAITLGTSNNNANGGLVNRYAGRYYNAAGDEVNGNGGVYTSASGELIARPELAQPGTMTAKVQLRCGTGGVHGGAVGMLDCGTFEYGAALDLSQVTWSVGKECVYNGAEQRPVTGQTQSGIELVEGADGDFVIGYAEDEDLVNAGTVHFTASAVAGEGKHFTGVFQGAFAILPANLAEVEGLAVSLEGLYYADDVSMGVRPEPQVKVGDELLVADRDYTLSYEGNDREGTATVTVSGTGNYTGAVSRTFEIAERTPMAACTVLPLENGVWTGESIVREPVVLGRDGVQLAEGADYTVSYLRDGVPTSDLTSAGEVTVRIVAASDAYRGFADVTYLIARADGSLVASASDCTATYSVGEQVLGKPVSVSGAHGAVTFAKEVGDARVSVSADGTVTIAAGLPAGRYEVSITATDAGDSAHEPAIASASFALVVSKAANGLVATAKNPAAIVYGAARTIACPIAVSGAQGAVTYAKSSGSERFTVAESGAISVAANTPTGTYDIGVAVSAAGDGNYLARSVTAEVTVTVSKASNPMNVLVRVPAAVAFSTAKRSVANPLAVSGAQGAVTYAKRSGSSRLTVDARTGAIAIAAGTPAGTYALSVAATAAGNANYAGATVSRTVKVTVAKAAQTISAKGFTVKYKGKKAGKKKVLAVKKTIKLKKKAKVSAKTAVRYAKSNKAGAKKIVVNRKTGVVTCKKGLAKGTYKVKVKLTAAANANYLKAKAKVITVKVVVK